MKKKNLKSLSLNKKSISNLDKKTGGVRPTFLCPLPIETLYPACTWVSELYTACDCPETIINCISISNYCPVK